MRGFSIGKLARAAGVSIDTIRYYERCGLLPQPARRPSGFREYSGRELRCLRLIRSARSLGFTLEQTAELVALESTLTDAAARARITEKLRMIENKIAELEHLRGALTRLLDQEASMMAPPQSIVDAFHAAAEAKHSPGELTREVHDDQ